MLNDRAVADLREALDALTAPRSLVPVSALPALGRLSGAGLDLSIDFAASERLGAAVIVARQRPGAPEALLSALTPRQRQVAALVLAGQSNKAIARALGLSLGTVKDHVHAILGRLGLPSRAALIASAVGR